MSKTLDQLVIERQERLIDLFAAYQNAQSDLRWLTYAKYTFTESRFPQSPRSYGDIFLDNDPYSRRYREVLDRSLAIAIKIEKEFKRGLLDDK